MTRHDRTALTWRTSTYSTGEGQCVAVATLPGAEGVATHDTKDPSGPVLVFAADRWSAFIGSVTGGELGG